VCGIFGECKNSLGVVKFKLKYQNHDNKHFEFFYCMANILPKRSKGDEANPFDLIIGLQTIKNRKLVSKLSHFFTLQTQEEIDDNDDESASDCSIEPGKSQTNKDLTPMQLSETPQTLTKGGKRQQDKEQNVKQTKQCNKCSTQKCQKAFKGGSSLNPERTHQPPSGEICMSCTTQSGTPAIQTEGSTLGTKMETTSSSTSSLISILELDLSVIDPKAKKDLQPHLKVGRKSCETTRRHRVYMMNGTRTSKQVGLTLDVKELVEPTPDDDELGELTDIMSEIDPYILAQEEAGNIELPSLETCLNVSLKEKLQALCEKSMR
jgi:hypothetical protein